jgi:dTDP-4-amino-4,6-dideoxygalactose transaminase
VNQNIPPLDLTRQYQLIGEQINSEVLAVLASGRYIGGSAVQNFEQDFANYIGVQESVACNSGTDALSLALRAFNIEPGDEVITTPFTFIATSEVINVVGAKPVFVDIDPDTFNLDLKQLEKAITAKTRAIIPVHLFGKPVNMTELMAIARSHNLIVIEDCAQATGAEWSNQKVGSMGDIGCFSFFPTKNLGAYGDGGIVTINNPEIAAKIRVLREHGCRIRYYHEVTGMNSRLDALQAAILKVKLPYLDTWNQQRTEVAQRYQKLLSGINNIILPQEITGGKTVWNQYTIRIVAKDDHEPREVKNNLPYTYRDQIREKLQELGIIAMVYYPLPLHLQPVYSDLGYKKGDFPQAEKVCDQVLSLPMFPELSAEEQERVIYGLKAALAV